MDNLVDLLLEEMDQELLEDNSFDKFLEDMNVNIILENEQQPQGNAQQQPQGNAQQQQTQGNAQQQQTQANTQQPNTGFKDKAKDIASGAKEKAGDILETLIGKFNSMAGNVDGFVSNQINSMSKGLASLTQKINGNETVKAIEDMSISAIEFLKVPRLVCDAGNTLQYVTKTFEGWLGGVFGGLKTKGSELKNNALKGLSEGKKAQQSNDNSKTGFLQNIMNACTGLLGGLSGAVKSVSEAFGVMWKNVKSTLGGAKQESVMMFLTLDEEVDYLLS